MKFLRLFYFIPCAALLFGAVSNAHADSVTGSVWQDVLSYNENVPVAGSAIYSTTPTATFTVSNPVATSLFSFSSSDDSNLTSFLTAGGSTVVFNSGTTASQTAGIDYDLFQFTGTTTLAAGTYTFGHDDGLLLYLNGTLAINAGGPTAYSTTNFNVCAAGSTINGTTCMADAGTYNFTLDYSEINGAPADLITDLPLTSVSPTPEPSSLILLGTGLIAAAGVARRRLKA